MLNVFFYCSWKHIFFIVCPFSLCSVSKTEEHVWECFYYEDFSIFSTQIVKSSSLQNNWFISKILRMSSVLRMHLADLFVAINAILLSSSIIAMRDKGSTHIDLWTKWTNRSSSGLVNPKPTLTLLTLTTGPTTGLPLSYVAHNAEMF